MDLPEGAPPSNEIIAARVYLLSLSYATLAPPEGGVNTEFSSWHIRLLWDEAALKRGSELDQLQREYQGDLEAFAQFNKSALMGRMIVLSASVVEQGTKDQRTENRPPSDPLAKIDRNIVSWRAAYGPTIAAGDAIARSNGAVTPKHDRDDQSAWDEAFRVAEEASLKLTR